jgi:succinate-semialdehyde dehydrogenase/glutarate-semialdehyde dehydrogenase
VTERVPEPVTEPGSPAVDSTDQLSADLFIGGAWVPARSGARHPVRDPGNGELVGTVAWGDAADADAALAAAAAAFPAWSRTRGADRAGVLRRTAELIRARREPIAVALTREQGKPLADSRKEIDFAAKVFDYYADLAPRTHGEWRSAAAPDLRSLVVREPVGVVVAIIPWNYPVDLFAWKVAPALAAGCTIVAKPSSLTPLATALVSQCIADAGVPKGVYGYVVGPGATLGEALVADVRSRLIAITGSTETGRHVMATAAAHIKRVNLELGGHAPFIVLDDADLDAAVPAALRRAFSNMGQICIAVKRIFVARPLVEEFAERLAAGASLLRIGHGLDPAVEYGPLTEPSIRGATVDAVGDALSRGARVLAGGHPPEGERFERGTYFLPTVLADVPDDALAMRSEVFGPLAPVAAFDSIDEVVARANATPYGLAAYVYGGDIGRMIAVAERLEFGGIGLNVNDITELDAPFGGFKESGIGRELGPEGLEAYLEVKHIRMRIPSG